MAKAQLSSPIVYVSRVEGNALRDFLPAGS